MPGAEFTNTEMPDRGAELADRVALVTGASRGIGAAIAEELSARGASVVLSSRKQDDLDAVAKHINQRFPDRAIPVAAHAGNPADLSKLVHVAMARLGRIDILVNNAATSPHFGHLVEADLSVWDKTFEVNIRGMFWLIREVVAAWMGANGGAIINVASEGGLRNAFGLGIYNVTKAAVIHLTRQMALELGESRIRVNAIAPGLVKTQLAKALWSDPATLHEILESTALGRMGEPHEIAKAVAFLASDDASFITGEVLVADGGFGARRPPVRDRNRDQSQVWP